MSVARELFDLPQEMARLPVDYRGYPVPAFVKWIDGQPDFRVIADGWREECHNKRKCWLCGGHMGRKKWFVIGPMCSITRTTMEPPCHRLCAEFAVKNCPFLVRPMAKRRSLADLESKLDGKQFHVDGKMIERNPGVSLVWECVDYKPFRVDGGWLITIGNPTGLTGWREGRAASREEVLESVMGGLPLLQAEAEAQGQAALDELTMTVGRWKLGILDRYFPQTKRTGEKGERRH